MSSNKKFPEFHSLPSCKRAIRNHDLRVNHHNLDDLIHALRKDFDAGKYPKAAERAISELQVELWKREGMNGSQLIGPGLRNLFGVEL